MTRCPYFHYSFSQPNNPLFGDNQCCLEEGHSGEHMKREILPPPQPQRLQQGWIKQETKVTDGISKENES